MTTKAIKKEARRIKSKLRVLNQALSDLFDEAETAQEERSDNFKINYVVDKLLMAKDSLEEAIDELDEV